MPLSPEPEETRPGDGSPSPERRAPRSLAQAEPSADAGILLASLVDLVHELTRHRAELPELIQTLLATLQNVVDEQAELQRDVASLQARIGTLAAPEGGQFDTHRASREQTRQARHRSRELMRRAAALTARASELVDQSQRLADDMPRAEPPDR